MLYHRGWHGSDTEGFIRAAQQNSVNALKYLARRPGLDVSAALAALDAANC